MSFDVTCLAQRQDKWTTIDVTVASTDNQSFNSV